LDGNKQMTPAAERYFEIASPLRFSQ